MNERVYLKWLRMCAWILIKKTQCALRASEYSIKHWCAACENLGDASPGRNISRPCCISEVFTHTASTMQLINCAVFIAQFWSKFWVQKKVRDVLLIMKHDFVNYFLVVKVEKNCLTILVIIFMLLLLLLDIFIWVTKLLLFFMNWGWRRAMCWHYAANFLAFYQLELLQWLQAWKVMKLWLLRSMWVKGSDFFIFFIANLQRRKPCVQLIILSLSTFGN